MNRIKSLLFAAVLVSIFAAVPAAAGEPGTVLLVRSTSDFKDALAGEIRELLTEAGYSVSEEESLSVLKNADLSDCVGVVVLNAGKAGRPNRRAKAFTERGGTLPSTVVLTTWGNPAAAENGFPARPELDAITSASLNDPEEIRRLARDVVSRLGLD